ncbi:DUF3306 domain-containing protein [Cupriavidus gilardii]|uniref:DUF3306 domain-containing protein n=1 Tax=Cupriavidus gilardii TaxID=82541 RepID=UPI001BAA0438|nr:DUF3306 domain-containing protein [Cupriavidus gilardii]MCT9015988.1 DUF3306 domain-containing protein [Cupriavidus gilardii]MCT9055758.1 DUF3306 domain-containing protein [Cupriavidus gilardii]WNG69921.1 DUF3306 domain-containing protein [Cupriavidus gilardii]
MSDSTETSFLSRWSRRKAAVREGKAVAAEPAPPPAAPVAVPAKTDAPAGAVVPEAEAPPAPTLADVAMLKPGDSVARFVAQGVDETVKRAALKTLFADPHFNVMDGLDIYIDDYSKPDPIPPDVLRRLRQSETLGLFDPIEQAQEAGTAAGPRDLASVDDAQAPAESSVDVPEDGTGEPEGKGQAAPDDGAEHGMQAQTGAQAGAQTAPAPAADVAAAVRHTGPATDKPA